jgi:hypothetical protein
MDKMLLRTEAILLSLLKSPSSIAAAEEQAMILRLKLASGPMGNEQERNRIEKLEDDLDVAIKKSLSGGFDGDECGEGFPTIYIYGPSANRLCNSVQPTLMNFHACKGSYVVR